MIIELLDGTRFDTADYSLRRLYHYIPSANIEHNSVAVDGRSDIILNSKINNRVIAVDFVYLSQDIFDFYLIREEVNALFLREEPYYITFKNEPHKRWLVKCNNGYDLQPNMRIEQFTIEFITINVYAESVATTQELKEWDFDKWSWNGTINWDDELIYETSEKGLIVKNLGNATINPRVSKLKITLDGYFPNGVTIANDTTGEAYRFNDQLLRGQQLVIDGIKTTVNGISRFNSTNKKLITLVPGENRIVIDGQEVDKLSFDFRFLYK